MRFAATILLISIGLVGCQYIEEKPEPEKPTTVARMVGRVASIHESDGFVLVEGFGDTRLGDGLLLTTKGPMGRTASLMVTGEKLGRYSAADIKAGELEVGDAVYAQPFETEEDEESFTGDLQPVPAQNMPMQIPR